VGVGGGFSGVLFAPAAGPVGPCTARDRKQRDREDPRTRRRTLNSHEGTFQIDTVVRR
jgi:hypothetical protein